MKSVIATSVVFAFIIAAGPAFAEDPGTAGPYTVSTAEYQHGGDYEFSCSTVPGCETAGAEMRAEVYYPDNLAAGPFPLLVFLHGKHSSCYRTSDGQSQNTWPCPSGYIPIPSYRGYDYIGRILASHGYIVASISADGINGQDSGATAIPDRAYLVDAHLNLWNTFNTAGVATDPYPFNGSLVGRVDLNRVGTMGHSRGGDGVVKHYSLFGGSSLYKVRAVLPIAPTNFSDDVIPNVNLGVILGYCDGDVFTLEGARFYDRARYADASDESSKYTFLSLGSNHNYFNTVWTPDCWTSTGSCWSDTRGPKPTPGTSDDFDGAAPDMDPNDPYCGASVSGNGRLTSAQQRAVGLAYTAAFFRYHIGNETQFGPLLRGDVLPPTGVPEVHVGYQPPASERLDLNRLMSDSELLQTTLTGTASLPGAVTSTGLELYDRCGFEHMDPWLSIPGDYCFSNQLSTPPGNSREVHLTNFFYLNPGLSRLHVSWNAPGDRFVNELPAGARDVSKFDTLQFRVGVDYEVPVLAPVSFSVILEDGIRSATVSTNSQLGVNDLYFPPGDTTATAVMNTLRLPLASFGSINLADLRRVTFQFDGTSAASVVFSDISFAGKASGPGCQASNTFVLQSNSRVTTTDGSPAVNTSGTGGTTIGSQAVSSGIRSVGAVNVLEQATVQGNIMSAGSITVAPSAIVSGVQSQFTAVTLPPLPVLPTFPPATGGNIPPINPGTPYLLSPGSYGTVTVNSGGVLKLSAGDYYFRNLTVNSASRVEVTSTTRVMVRDSLAYRSPFVDSGANVQPIFLGFAGTNLVMEARFDGTLVAPNAQVSFGIGSGLTYTGSFFGRNIEVRSGSALVCTQGVGGGTPPVSCSDGVKNGSETGVDCGGSVCGPCGIGQPCIVATDCTTNTCVAGICQPLGGSVTATRAVTADWGGGYCVTLKVTNSAAVPTTNWSVSLNTNQANIYTSWNGVFGGTSGVISVAPATSWNRVIPAGSTDSTVGFCANRWVSGSGTLPIILSASGTY